MDDQPRSAEPPPEDLCFWIYSLSTASLRGQAWKLAPYEITPQQVGILALCSTGYANTVSTIARILPIDAAAVSRQVQKLARRRLLRRMPSENDRRSAKLVVTEEGMSLLPDLAERVQANNNVLLTGISEEEKDAFIGTIKKMLANISAEERNREEADYGAF